MRHKPRMTKALIGLALLIVLVVVLSFLYINTLNNTFREDTTDYLTEITVQSVHVVSAQLMGHYSTLQALADSFSLSAGLDPDACLPLMRKEAEVNNFKRMGMILSDGTVYTTDNVELDLAGREYFRRALEGDASISNLTDYADGQKIVVYCVPVENGGKTLGALFATHDVHEFESVLQLSSFDGEGYSYIATSSGDIILRSAHPLAGASLVNLFTTAEQNVRPENDGELQAVRENMKKGLSGLVQYSYHGVSRYMGYALVGFNDWYILSIVPTSVVSGKSSAMLTYTFLLMGSLISFFIFLAALFYHSQFQHRKGLYTLAYMDSVTGIYNQNGFYQASENCSKRGMSMSSSAWTWTNSNW